MEGRVAPNAVKAAEAQRLGAVAVLADPAQAWSLGDLAGPRERIGLPVIQVPGLSHHLATLADRFFGWPSRQLEVFGISGSLGKTTLSHLVSRALESELTCGVIDGADGLDVLAVRQRLNALHARGARAVAMALSPGRLARSDAASLRLSHLMLTHLDADASPAAAAQGIACRLATSPSPDWVVVNLDDPAQRDLLEALPAAICVAGYTLLSGASRPARCDLWLAAEHVDATPRGLRVRVRSLGEATAQAAELEVALIGEFNVANMLALLALKCSRGLPLERAARELALVRGVPGRMECFGGEGAPMIVVDSASTPMELERALSSLRRHGFRRLMTVFGCDGRMPVAERPVAGRVVERLSDQVILTDDNPRDAGGERIVADILSGLTWPDKAIVERQRGLAIRIAVARAGVGDAILVAGKGGEKVQDMGELKVHFSDRAQVVEALREWREGHH
nr:cyanophycin synthetase [Thiorhodococcus minor]